MDSSSKWFTLIRALSALNPKTTGVVISVPTKRKNMWPDLTLSDVNLDVYEMLNEMNLKNFMYSAHIP